MGSTDDLVVSIRRLEISKELAVALNRVWVKSLIQTTYSKYSNLGGLDGATYIFSVLGSQQGNGWFQGTTWSPPKGSIPRDMVDLAMKLFDLTKENNAMSEGVSQELIQMCAAIEKKLD